MHIQRDVMLLPWLVIISEMVIVVEVVALRRDDRGGDEVSMHQEIRLAALVSRTVALPA